MKKLSFIFGLLLSFSAIAQNHAVSHGTIYGSKPNVGGMQNASNLETFMGKKTRISATIKGKILNVSKQKGGWFDIDAGNGKVIAAHFKDYGINLPSNLKGRPVIVEGVAEKQFIADDMQHFAGDSIRKKQHAVKTDNKHKVTFEVTGMMVEK